MKLFLIYLRFHMSMFFSFLIISLVKGESLKYINRDVQHMELISISNRRRINKSIVTADETFKMSDQHCVKQYGLITNTILTDSALYITKDDQSSDVYNYVDIIGSKDCSSEGSEANDLLYVIQKLETKHQELNVIKLLGERNDCQKFVTEIKEKLKKLTQRPRKLLVLLCPVSGSHCSEKIYNDSVAPLFDLANISTDVIESTSKDHIYNVVSTYNTDEIDGIVVCGGDGSFSQCINGVFKITQTKARIDYDDPKKQLHPTKVPIGHIPTGTHNIASKFCNGVVDVVTATLGIIQGSTTQLGVLNLYSDNKWIRSGCIGIGFGNVTEFTHYVDNYRWMKSYRYGALLPYYVLFKTMPEFKVKLELTLSYTDTESKNKRDNPDHKTVSLDGVYNDIIVTCHDVYHPDCYIGSGRWTSGHVTLNAYSPCYRLQLLKNYFDRLLRSHSYIHPYFVEEKTITGYKMKVHHTNIDRHEKDKRNTYRLTVDSEIVELEIPEWEVRFHDSVATVFTSLV